MMFLNFEIYKLKIFAVILIIQITNRLCITEECIIHSKQYSHEYLFQPKSIHPVKVYIKPIQTVDDIDYIKWNVEKISNTSLVYIQSQDRNEFLCSSINYNRRLFSSSHYLILNKTANTNCLWKIVPIKNVIPMNNNKYTYLIWNKMYNEQLYTPTSFFKKPKDDKREIYLWREKDKIFSSNNFNWLIDCENLIYF